MNEEINPKSVNTDICGSLATGVRWLVEAPTSSLQEDGITLTTKRAHSLRVDTVLRRPGLAKGNNASGENAFKRQKWG